MRCIVSKHMYCVFRSRAAGRYLSSLVILASATLLSACSSDISRFNYPAFGLADNNSTGALPVPPEPLYGNPSRSSAPPPDYSNRPAQPSYDRGYNQGRNNAPRNYGARQGYPDQANGAQTYGNQTYGSQGYGQQSYGRPNNSGGYAGQSSYGSNNRPAPSQPYNQNGSYNPNGANTYPDNRVQPSAGYGNRDGALNNSRDVQERTRVASLPERPSNRGPLPPKADLPKVTYKPSSNNSGGRMVEVQRGQTLYGIARAHGVRVEDIRTVNNLQGNSLKLGQKLIIPGAGQQTAYAAPRKQPATTNAGPARTEPVLRNRVNGRTYRVVRGDSLYGIARRHGMTSSELARFNGMSQSATLKPGQILSVPRDAKAAQPRSSAPAQVARRSQPESRPGPSMLPKPQTRSVSKFRWPVEGRIISRFGSKTNGTHNDGVNLAVPVGTSVRSAENGVVAYAGNELKGYGNLILVRHADDWVSAYAHVDSILVKRGDSVSRGQVIAKSGKSGSVDRPQVHFELRKNSKPVDPLTHLASR